MVIMVCTIIIATVILELYTPSQPTKYCTKKNTLKWYRSYGVHKILLCTPRRESIRDYMTQKFKETRDVILVHDTPLGPYLQPYQILSKYLKACGSYAQAVPHKTNEGETTTKGGKKKSASSNFCM